MRRINSAELARRADMDPTTLWRIESGGRPLTGRFRDVLARVLMVPVPQFYAPIGSPIPPPDGDVVEIETIPYHPDHAIASVARRLRAVQRMTLQTELEIAMAVGATEAEVLDWLEGRSMPPLPLMNHLARLAGFTLHWLYHGDDSGMSRGIAARLRTLTPE